MCPPSFPYPSPAFLGPDHATANDCSDLWSIGVITYILLCGYPPFYGKTDREIFSSVRKGAYDFPSPEWDTVSDNAKEFVLRLLMLEPGDRPTAKEVRDIVAEHLGEGDEEFSRISNREVRSWMCVLSTSARLKDVCWHAVDIAIRVLVLPVL